MSGFHLAWSPWSAALSLLAVLVVAAVGLLAWWRRGCDPLQGILELCRLGLVAVAAWLLNQPEYVEEFEPDAKPHVAVICDRSPSMETEDVELPGTTSGLVSRRDATALLQSPTAWEPLAATFDVELRSFGADNGRSNLFESISEALNAKRRAAAIVLVSDGDWNEGLPPVDAATRMRLAGVPLLSVPVGRSTRLPDLALISLDSPTFGVAGKTVRIPFTVESAFPRERLSEVKLTTDQGDVVVTELSVRPMGRTNGVILWKPTETADVEITLALQHHADETQADNNTLKAPISIREEKLRVLLVESYPRWEYRYLRNALSRDPGVELSCLLFHPRLEATGGGNKDYIKQFPSEIEELSQFDVVFLGDVGIGDGQLTEEDCRLLKGIVEHQASGLVLMPGWQGRQVELLETALGALYPVVLDPTQPGGWGSRTPSHFELTQSGQGSLLTKLADTEDENLHVWESLPGFQWYAAVERAKPGMDVLCVHQDIANEFGRIPLLVTRTYGSGKILFMGTDGAWRWRKGVEDRYHYRFWGQVVRWMAYQRNMAKGDLIRLFYSPDQPHLDRTVTLNANLMYPSGEPLREGDVLARVLAPSGQTETVRFQSTGDEWGAFEGAFTPAEPGPHQVTLACKQIDSTLKASIFVQGVAEERAGRPARLDVMSELATVTGGRVVDVADMDQVVEAIAALPERAPSVRRVQLWSHPVVTALVVVLLGAFWIGRKAAGLI